MAAAPERVLVTGANGFIGSHVAQGLAFAGFAVRGMTRPASSASRRTSGEPPPHVEQVVADMEDDRAVERALRGVTGLVHAAGLAHVARGASLRERFRRSNVDCTRALVDAAGRTGVRRVVLISSVAVCARQGGVIDEAAPERPTTAYGESKLEAERVALELASRYGMACAVLRPPMVYGAGMKGRPLQLFRWIDRGLPLPLGAVEAPRSVLYVGNLVTAVEAVLGAWSGGRAAFLLADPQPISIAAFARMAAAALGRPARLLAVRPSVLRAALALAQRGRAMTGRTGSASITELLDPLVLDTTRITAATGFVPRTSTADGVRHTAEWFCQWKESSHGER